ncbi:thrombospondin type 3 repeat-containing protein [Microbulbifer sp. SA54]|uniref:thrombospondin type 3 repeat-containing protein n=1 Tax=Microbulbifer sp. SA54 TaxID=3401577 RepID=UPI003AAE08B4
MPPSEFTATPQQLRERIAIDSPAVEITLENTPLLSGTFFEFYSVAQNLYYNYLYEEAWGFNPLDIYNGVFQCRHGGTVELRYSAADTVLSAFYFDCVEELEGIEGRAILSGAQRQSFLRDESGERLVRLEYDDYRVAAEGDSLTTDGVVEVIDSRVDSRPGDILLDLSIRDSSGLNIRAEKLHFDLYRDNYRVHFDSAIEALSGTLATPAGSVVVTGAVKEPDDPLQVHLAGATVASASALVAGIYPNSLNMLLGFDGDGDGLRDNTLFAMFDEFEEEPFLRGDFATPVLRGTSLDPNGDVEQQGHNRVAFDVAPFFRDPGGNLLEFTLELVRVEEVHGSDLSDPRTELAGTAEYLLEQIHAGHYRLTSTLDRALVVYSFEVTARNSHGQTTTEPLVVEVPVYRDQDDDGTPDISDDDIDGDGVSNYRDLWPRDPNEWEDTDGDGIGNNADQDDDGDLVADGDDVQPLDFLCSIESDTNGEVCLHRVLLTNGNPGEWKVVRDASSVTYFWDRPTTHPWGFSLASDGILYYWSALSTKIYRWDANSGHFLESVHFDHDRFSDEVLGVVNRLAIAPSQNAAYVFFDTIRGTVDVTRVDLAAGFEETVFLNRDQVAALGFEHSRWLEMKDQTKSALVVEAVDNHSRDYVAFGLNGEELDRHTSEVPEAYAAEDDDVVLRPSQVAPFCTWGVHFDEVTSTFMDAGNGDPESDPCTNTLLEAGIWPVISADGQFALTSAGIIDRNQNLLAEIPDISPANAVWRGQTLYHLSEEENRIARYASSGEELGHMPVPDGYVHNLLSAGDHLVYLGINREDEHVLILRYEEK